MVRASAGSEREDMMQTETIRCVRNLVCAVFLMTAGVFVATVQADGCGSSACECVPPAGARWDWASGSLDCGAGAAAYCDTACTGCYGANTTSTVSSCDDDPAGGLSIVCACTPVG